MKRSPLRRKSLTKKPRPGRLEGYALKALRTLAWYRDGGKCQECKKPVLLDSKDWSQMEMAHIKSRGAGGEDSLNNVRTLCKECHSKSHNCGGKPVPSKMLTRYEARAIGIEVPDEVDRVDIYYGLDVLRG